MICPKCSQNNDKVIDSRFNKKLNKVRRRRECLNCGCRNTTYESSTYEAEDIIQFLNQTQSVINTIFSSKKSQIKRGEG